MHIKVIINNYNYAKYLNECIESALQQSTVFDQIIVVDDGSTDQSREIIDSYCSRYNNVFSIFKSNGGQLSCFSAALKYIDEGDIVFLLDADDVYAPNYVEKMLPEMDADTDHAFSQDMVFKNNPIQDAVINNSESILIPSSTYITLKSRCYVGGPSSTNVFTGAMLQKLLPYPFEKEWAICADSFLIKAASILGARKKYVKSTAVGYRIHGNNLFYGKKHSNNERVENILRENRLIKFFSKKYAINRNLTLIKALFELLNLSAVARSETFIPSIRRTLRSELYRSFQLSSREFRYKLLAKIKG